MKWVPYVVISLVILLVYLNYLPRVKDDLTDRAMVKRSRVNEGVVMKPIVNSKSGVNNESAVNPVVTRIVASSDNVGRLNPLKSPMLAEKRRRAQEEGNILASIAGERRESLNLRFVGNGSWSLFSELQVSKYPVHNTLFAFGPFHVSRTDERVAGRSMRLIIEDNQKQLGVLTGRIVVKVKDLYDIDPIVREYGLKIDTVSVEIKTAYLDASHVVAFAQLNETLKEDQRVERFYFEVVRNDWVKN